MFFRFLIAAFKNLRREFYMPPTIENTYREAQLNSECNIALAIIDGIMFHHGILGRELFEKFDESGDGYITHEEFQTGIDSFGLKIEHSWIRSIVKTIDAEGDGYIGVEELTEAMEKVRVCKERKVEGVVRGAKDEGGARSEATKTKRCECCAFSARCFAPLHCKYPSDLLRS